MADKKISALTAATTPLAGTEVLPIVQSSTTVKVAVSDVTAGRAVSALSYVTTGGTGNGQITITKNSTVATENTAGLAIQASATNGYTELLLGTDDAIDSGYIQTAGKNTSWTSKTLVLQPNGGNVKIGAGNVVIGTSGKGIDFSATSGTGTSELFSDYEEGTWTPALNGSTPGTVTATVSGTYTKIGRTVFCTFSIVQTSAGAGTGDTIISGLPYAISSQGAGTLGSVQNLKANVVRIQPYGSSGSSFYLFGMAAAAASDTAALAYNTYIQNNTQLYGTFSYITA